MTSDKILETLRAIDLCIQSLPSQNRQGLTRLRHFPKNLSSEAFADAYIRPLTYKRRDPQHQQARLDILATFVQHVLTGAYPPAESMYFIATCLNRYLQQYDAYAKGTTRTLDEVFGLMPTQKAGNPVRKDMKRNLKNVCLFEMAVLRVTARSKEVHVPSIDEAADAISMRFQREFDVQQSGESLAKYYRGKVGRAWEEAIQKSVTKGEMRLDGNKESGKTRKK